MIRPYKFKQKILVIVAATLSLAVIISSCNGNKNNNADVREKYIIPDSLMKTLTIDTVKTCLQVDAVSLTGMVNFNQDKQVNIFPLVSGNIQDVKVQLGDYVTAGQQLAVVKSSEMAGYSNNLAVAETNLNNAKKQLSAASDLYKSGLSSQLDVTTAQTNYDQAVAQLEMVKRVLTINGNNTQGNYIIKAPISGFVVQKNITNNTVIRTDNGNNLFTISDLKNVWIEANVYESNISNVHLGDDVDVTTLSYPSRVFKGKVDKVFNVLDPTNKVMKIRIVLPNSDYALKPQMFAGVKVISNTNKQALCVASAALNFDHSQYYVLVYNSNSDVHIASVEVSGSLGNKTYITSGLKEGDRVLSSNVVLIYEALNN